MSHSYLRESDSFEHAHAGHAESYLFVRRVARQVAQETDKVVADILQHLGISSEVKDEDLTDADMHRLDQIQNDITSFIVDICQRKTA